MKNKPKRNLTTEEYYRKFKRNMIGIIIVNALHIALTVGFWIYDAIMAVSNH